MEPVVFTTAQLDAPTTETMEEMCRALRDCGCFYQDPERGPTEGGVIYAATSPNGKTWATRIVPPMTFGETVLSRGIVRILQDSRQGARPLFRAFWTAYEKMITKLPITHPEVLDLPQLSTIYQLPVMVSEPTSGRLVPAWPGLHPDQGIFFSGEMVPPMALERVDPAYPHLHAWLSDIRFTAGAYAANLMGYVLACLARPILPLFPFLVLDSIDKKCGKSRVAEAIHYFLTGRVARPFTFTGDESELEKRLASSCGKPGPNLIMIDNVRPKRGQSGVIRSQFFAAAVTCPTPTVRPVYGRASIPVDWPIIILTMNEAVVEQDLSDRVVRVVLSDPGRYFDPDPLEYAKLHLQELRAEALHLLSQIVLRPDFHQLTRFHDFEQVATVGAGLFNMQTNYDASQLDTPDALVRELHAAVQELGERATTEALAVHLRMGRDYLPELASHLRRHNAVNDEAQGRVLGALLQKYRGRRYALHGQQFTLQLCGDRWKVNPCA